MKIRKSISPILVSVSVFAFTGFSPHSALAQVVINCSQHLFIGNNAQCANKAQFVINPDGSTSLKTGCVVNTTPPHAGKCIVNTGGIPPTKNVRVDFDRTFLTIKNGGKQVRIEDFRMQYKTSVPAASKFTFTPTAIQNSVTIKIGGTVNVTTPNVGLGTYSGTVTVRANPI